MRQLFTRMQTGRLWLLLPLLLLLMTSTGYSQNKVVDGSFSSQSLGCVSGSWFANNSVDVNNVSSGPYSCDGTGPGHWTWGNSPVASPDGGNFLSFYSVPGNAYQESILPTATITGLVVGQQYTFSFWYARTPTPNVNFTTGVTANPVTFNIYSPGLTGYTAVPVLSDTWVWHQYSVTVTAAFTSTYIQFTGVSSGTTSNSGYISLDGVYLGPPCTAPATPTLSAGTQPGCGGSTGTFNITNFNSAYTYTFSPAGPTVNASGVVTASPGTYAVTAASGACNSSASASITINPVPATPSAPTFAAATQPTCATPTGTINLTSLPASWTLTRSGTSSATLTGSGTTYADAGLAAGSYTYTVTNASGCVSVASASQTLTAATGCCTAPAAPALSSVTQPTCSVSTGTFTITNYSASNTYTFSPTGPTVNASGVVTASAGTYTVIAASGSCNSSTTSVVVNAQPATPSAPTFGTITQPTCAVTTGTINLTGLPSSGTWTLTRNGTVVTSSGTGTTYADASLAPGTYTYTVTNAAGCVSVASASQTLTAPTGCCVAPSNAIIAGGPATYCVGATATALTVSWSGEQSSPSYQWQVNGGNVPTGIGNPTYIPVTTTPGTYTYTVNVFTCSNFTTSAPVVITVVAPPAAPTITVTNPTCAVTTGSVTVSSPISGATYTLLPGGATSTTGIFTGLAAGSGPYTVTYTLSGGCQSAVSNSVSVGAAATGCCVAPSNAIIASAATYCVGATATALTVSWSGEQSSPQYQWQVNGSNVPTGIGNPTYTPVTTTPGTYTYTVNVFTCNNFTTSSPVVITVVATPATPVITVTNPTCAVTTGSVTVSSPVSGVTYTLSNGATSTTGIFTGLAAGSGPYTVTASNGSCSSTASNAVTVGAAATGCIPDLTPILTVLPATVYGTTNITIVTDVYEVNSIPSSGLISVYISKDPLVTATFNGAATFVGGKIVQNSAWTFDGSSNASYYILTSTQAMTAGGKLSFGLNAVVTPGSTTGVATFAVTILGGSGGETNAGNNTDSEKINYFSH